MTSTAIADLDELLLSSGLTAVSIEPLPRLDVPANMTTALRVTLADGAIVKGAEVSSAGRAETIEAAVTHIDCVALPRVLGRNGRALLFEWFHGEQPNRPQSPSRLAASAGALLAEFHARAPLRLIAEPRLTRDGAESRFDQHVDALVDGGVLETADVDRLRGWAHEHRPDRDDAVFLHTDLAPDNLLMHQDVLRVIDNNSWSVGPAVFDLARTWWRWPMDRETREIWQEAYTDGRGSDVSLTSFPYWVVTAAVASTAYRFGGSAELVTAAASRIRSLAGMAGTDGDALLCLSVE